ncbi:MAG: metallophosphoesterase [Candidatus Latescibacteria bacterium]|nr:metallophosphoesterase [Candidatus Latescibacterota bacterium]
MDLTRQLIIIHLSDVHFGRSHRFVPPRTPGGDVPEEDTYPTLLEKLKEDLSGKDPQCPVLVCITGDLAESADVREFQEAECLIQGLAEAEILGKKPGIKAIFVVPGNHDVKYDSDNIGVRWQQWAEFYNRIFTTTVRRENPWDFVQLHDRVDEYGAVILCLNSAIYVQKGKPDGDRGRLDIRQLTAIEKSLKEFPKSKLDTAIRIALIHHHPVLIPSLAEPNRGYDAVHNSGILLASLRRYGFHLILHGHKHNPHIFSHDVNPAYQHIPEQCILIAAGGSAGSTLLPSIPNLSNCYNRITIKWHPAARQTRVHVETRGLTVFNEDRTEALPSLWQWQVVKVDDRHFFGGKHAPVPQRVHTRSFNKDHDQETESERTRVYENTRGNLAVASVRPSLVPDQAYEVRLWIVHHGSPQENSTPEEVVWSAGPKFPVVSVQRDADPNFCIVLNYWGPMLVQATMRFPDGHIARTYVYAQMPTDYSNTL